ncbi:MAG: hypothetical protein ACAI44_19575 [Candidatus Sericytochromatia bacterium]
MKRVTSWILSLSLLGLSTPAFAQHEPDYASVQAANDFVDIAFPATESVGESAPSVAETSGDTSAFTPDGRWLFVQTFRRDTTPQTKKHWGYHINKIDTQSGKIVGDIPIALDTWAGNPLLPLLKGVPGLKPDDITVSAIGASDKHLAVLIDAKGSRQDYVVVLFDVNSGKPVKLLDGKPLKATYLDTPVFSADGRYLTASGGQGRQMLYVWDTASGKLLSHFERQRQDSDRQPAFAVLGQELLYLGDETDDDHHNAFYSLSLGSTSPRQVFGGSPWRFATSPTMATISPSGSKVYIEACNSDDDGPAACGNNDAPGRIFSLPGFDPVVSLDPFDGDLDLSEAVDSRYLQWSRDEEHLLLAGEPRSEAGSYALVMNVASGRPEKLLKLPIRHDSLLVTGIRGAEFLILGLQPRSPFLRIVRIPAG